MIRCYWLGPSETDGSGSWAFDCGPDTAVIRVSGIGIARVIGTLQETRDATLIRPRGWMNVESIELVPGLGLGHSARTVLALVEKARRER